MLSMMICFSIDIAAIAIVSLFSRRFRRCALIFAADVDTHIIRVTSHHQCCYYAAITLFFLSSLFFAAIFRHTYMLIHNATLRYAIMLLL